MWWNNPYRGGDGLPDVLARPLEMAWQQGFERGLWWGVFAGLVAGVLAALILRRPQ